MVRNEQRVKQVVQGLSKHGVAVTPRMAHGGVCSPRSLFYTEAVSSTMEL